MIRGNIEGIEKDEWIEPELGDLHCLTTYNGQADPDNVPYPFDIQGFPGNIPVIQIPKQGHDPYNLAKMFAEKIRSRSCCSKRWVHTTWQRVEYRYKK